MPENGAVALKPANLTVEEAAALSFGGTTALSFFRRGKLQRGEKVLINGASGGVGTAAVQLAKQFGAPWQSMTSSKKVIAGPSTGKAEDLRFLAQLAEAGEFKPVIGRSYPLDQIADAHWHVDTGHKKGNVVVTLG